MEYMDLGDLHTHLIESAPTPESVRAALIKKTQTDPQLSLCYFRRTA